jgi:hypothetical protein
VKVDKGKLLVHIRFYIAIENISNIKGMRSLLRQANIVVMICPHGILFSWNSLGPRSTICIVTTMLVTVTVIVRDRRQDYRT